jgi:protein-S-isoprenylcysteine O-methyltransferase Ste14
VAHSYAAWAARWRVPLSFAFAIVYLVLSQPTPVLLILGFSIALLGLILRLLAAGFLDKNERLTRAGPFQYTRNPLYLGNFMLGLGLMIAGASWLMGIAFIILFALIYIPVMRSEEAFLRLKFGPVYEAYARNVPLFIPLPGRRFHEAGQFQWGRYKKNREYEAACGYFAILVFLIVKTMLR